MKFTVPKPKKVQQETLPIGLDIGHGYLKLLPLIKTPEGIELNSFFIQKLPPLKEIPSFLKDLFAKYKFPATKVNFSLSGKATLVRDLWVPLMSPKELKASIQYELDQYIPFPVEEVYYDSYILEETPFTRKEGQMRIILAVANRKIVDGRLKWIKDASFIPNIIDMDVLALYNAFMWAADDSQRQETIGLVDIGFSKIIIDIVSNGILTFTREIEHGTNRVAESVSKEISVNKDEAERMICTGDSRIETKVGDLVTKLSKELWSSFEYYEGQEQRAVEKVYLTGGGSLLLGLVEQLDQVIDLPVSIWNPFGKIKINLDSKKRSDFEKAAPLMAIACGLACREL